jgi:hypothetical protein
VRRYNSASNCSFGATLHAYAHAIQRLHRAARELGWVSLDGSGVGVGLQVVEERLVHGANVRQQALRFFATTLGSDEVKSRG